MLLISWKENMQGNFKQHKRKCGEIFMILCLIWMPGRSWQPFSTDLLTNQWMLRDYVNDNKGASINDVNENFEFFDPLFPPCHIRDHATYQYSCPLFDYPPPPSSADVIDGSPLTQSIIFKIWIFILNVKHIVKSSLCHVPKTAGYVVQWLEERAGDKC